MVECDEQAHEVPVFSHMSRCKFPPSVEVPGSFLCAAHSWMCVSVQQISARSCLLLKELKEQSPEAMYGANPCLLTVQSPTV